MGIFQNSNSCSNNISDSMSLNFVNIFLFLKHDRTFSKKLASRSINTLPSLIYWTSSPLNNFASLLFLTEHKVLIVVFTILPPTSSSKILFSRASFSCSSFFYFSLRNMSLWVYKLFSFLKMSLDFLFILLILSSKSFFKELKLSISLFNSFWNRFWIEDPKLVMIFWIPL